MDFNNQQKNCFESFKKSKCSKCCFLGDNIKSSDDIQPYGKKGDYTRVYCLGKNDVTDLVQGGDCRTLNRIMAE